MPVRIVNMAAMDPFQDRQIVDVAVWADYDESLGDEVSSTVSLAGAILAFGGGALGRCPCI